MTSLLTEISWYWLVLIALLALGLSFWLYHKDQRLAHLSRYKVFFLGTLRFLSFVFIGVLILGILFEVTKTNKNKPLIVFDVDVSQSMLNYSDSNEVKNIQEKIQSIQSQLGEEYDFVQIPADSLRFSSSESNLSQSINFIDRNYSNRNVGAVVSFSDGNYNVGQNPAISIEKLKFIPFYTVGIGDTIDKKDQYLLKAYANKIAFLGNDFPLKVSLSNFGYNQKETELLVQLNGNTYKKEKVLLGEEAQEIDFMIPAKKVGIQHVKLILKGLENEYTLENNELDVFIQVLDSRNKIVMISGAPSPDIACFKQVFKSNENIEFKEVLLNKFDFKTDYNLLILNNIPSSAQGKELMNWVQKGKYNSIMINGINTSSANLSNVLKDVNIRVGRSVNDFLPKLNAQFKEFSITKDEEDFFLNTPPLRSLGGNIGVSNQNQVLMYQRVGNLQKKDPLVYLSKNLDSKHIVFFGEGIWKWRMMDFQMNKNFDLFDGFIKKMTQYLMVTQNKKKLQVSAPESSLTSKEIEVECEFYNDAYERIIDPEIEFELTKSDGTKSKFNFLAAGDHYSLNLGKLSKGTYSWKASTQFNGRKYLDEGSFFVQEKSLEQLNTKSNFNVLYSMSEKSGGKFVTYRNASSMVELIKNDDNIASTSYEEKEFRDLLDFVWLLFIIAGLLGLEWFVRKYSGTY